METLLLGHSPKKKICISQGIDSASESQFMSNHTVFLDIEKTVSFPSTSGLDKGKKWIGVWNGSKVSGFWEEAVDDFRDYIEESRISTIYSH